MRNIFFLVLLGLVCALCRSEEGSGSVVVITPTNKVAPPTDATNDSGSGVDDEDDDDDDGSTPNPTRITTFGVTTTGATTTTDDDEDGSSGSGSGEIVTVVSKTDKSTTETATDSTDLYISDSTTEKVVVIDKSTTKVQVTTATDSGDSTTPSTDAGDLATTRMSSVSDSNVVYQTTNVPKRTPSTSTTTVPSTSTMAVPSTEQTTDEKTTSKARGTTETPDITPKVDTSVTAVQQKTSETQPTKFNPRESTTERVKETTTAKEPDVMARNEKEGEGFTLTTEVIAGVVGCALLALLLIAFLMYRLKKRDEGSYLLDDSCGNDAYKKVGSADKEAFV